LDKTYAGKSPAFRGTNFDAHGPQARHSFRHHPFPAWLFNRGRSAVRNDHLKSLLPRCDGGSESRWPCSGYENVCTLT
jgi:hypothetical protein